MTEMVWDPAYKSTQGPFEPSDAYALYTGQSPELRDMGCWDGGHDGGGCTHGGQGDHGSCQNGNQATCRVAWTVAWAPDHKGVLLTKGGNSTWLPVAASWNGKSLPQATLRGCYLNWLLKNRGTTPAIPAETRWQRLQRGAQVLVTDILGANGAPPAFRLAGMGTSGNLLIPPSPSLSAARNAATSMTPACRGGALEDTLAQGIAMLRGSSPAGCRTGLVVILSDGNRLGGDCGPGTPYESQRSYSEILARASMLHAAGPATFLAWSVDGSREWAADVARVTQGTALGGDAVSSLDTAAKSWAAGQGSPLSMTLAADQPSLTRVSPVHLTVTTTHVPATLLLNGKAVTPTGLVTVLPTTLAEGANLLSITVTDACGGSASAQTTIVLDTMAPLVTLSAPASGSYTNATTLTVAGLAMDAHLASVMVNGQLATLRPDGTFTAVFTPAAGTFTFSATAADLAGNTATTPPLSVFVDRTLPIVKLVAPMNGLFTNASTLKVTGTVQTVAPIAQVTVNGQVATLGAGGTFTATLAPAQGPLAIVATATDQAHNQASSATVNVVIDRIPPVLVLSGPADGFQTNAASLQVLGTVNKASTVLLNEQPLSVADPATPGAPFTFATTLAPGEGPLLLKAVAIDWAGNVTTVTHAGLIDRTQPVIHLAMPLPTLTNRASLTMTGTVSEASALLTLNGQRLVLDAQGGFSTAMPLAQGANAIEFVAVDPAGNRGTLAAQVELDQIAPNITLTSPVPALTGLPTLSLLGTINKPIVSLTLNGQVLQPDASGQFMASVVLTQGNNTLRFQAVDLAGNVGTLVVQSQLDMTPPVIGLTGELPTLTTNKSLTLLGTVSKPSSVLTLNGQVVPLDAQGGFTAPFTLIEGSNTLNFQAVDVLGNVGTFLAQIQLDSTPPVIFFDSPMDGFATSQMSTTIYGHVDDPAAHLVAQGQDTALDATGHFTVTVAAVKEGAMRISAQVTDSAGNIGQNAMYVRVEIAPPVLVWADSTPTEGARLTSNVITATVLTNKATATTINGERVELEPNDSDALPFKASTQVVVEEGQVVLTATAVDGAGNQASLTRTLSVGLTAPTLIVSSPDFDATSRCTTSKVGVTLKGTVTAPDFVAPFRLTQNGAAVVLAADGSFTLPMVLAAGDNPVTLEATNAYGQTTSRKLIVFRTAGVPPQGSEPGIAIDWPQQGFVTSAATLAVQGHVEVPGMTAALNGTSLVVDPQTLAFSGSTTLSPGANVVTVQGTDAEGRSVTAVVSGIFVPAGTSTCTWITPLEGAKVATKVIPVSGRATQPGIATITVNGVSMALDASSGTFSGSVPLQAPGPNALMLVASALDGTSLQDRRMVSFEPPLPQVVLNVPGSARPGETISIQVSPGSGTNLSKAVLTWNGVLLSTVTSPWDPVMVQVPVDAVVGTDIPVAILATDAQGATVAARAAVTIYGAGALLLEAYDDVRGLRLTDQKGTATLEGGASAPLDAHGRVALPTALPENWILIQKTGFSPVWRSAGLTVGGLQAAVDARLTPLAPAQNVEGENFTGTFGGGVFHVSFPVGTPSGTTAFSVTPLSTQGLPGLLPLGWSVLSAWWLDLGGASMPNAATGRLDLAATLVKGAPPLAPDLVFAWARWDVTLHAWVVLAAPVASADLTALSLPGEGGYALLLADPGATAPPVPVAGSVLPGFQGSSWQPGLTATGSIAPAFLPSVEAINGARATAAFQLPFGNQLPVPSSTLLQMDVLESYTLVDQSVIEPDGSTQDAVASRWLLETVDGRPVLSSALGEGLGLHLPVGMSRTFAADQLVEGRILVGFYHDGAALTNGGSGLIGAAGGTVGQGGVTVSLAAGAVSGTTLVRVHPDAGDLGQAWPELSAYGTVASSFTVDVVGTLQAGLGLRLDTLEVPTGVRPLLVQRRTVQDQPLLVAVGEVLPSGSGWVVSATSPLLQGGAFAVLVPNTPWDWISGTAALPLAVGRALQAKLGARAKTALASGTQADPSGVMALADVKVEGGFLLAVSGPDGVFALPAFQMFPPYPCTLTGSRWDMGLQGTLTADVPSQNNTLLLATMPFRVVTVLPDPTQPAEPGSVFEVVTSTPADPASMGGVALKKVTVTTDGSTRLDAVAATTGLSLDGRTLLLTPASPLDLGSTYQLVIAGYQSTTGEVAPAADLLYNTLSVAPALEVGLTQVKLTYPDADLRVTVTVPQGAVPPGAALEVEAHEMGSIGTGTMPPTGDLSFLLRANLGERLLVRVQLQDGRVFTGYLSRYEAIDGSGKVTLGQDGGLVVSSDGLASATFQAGALSAPVEMKVVFTRETPVEMDPALAGQVNLLGRVRLLSSQAEVQLAQRPILQIKAPDQPNLTRHPYGLGAYAILDRVEGFESDGTPTVYFEFSDTAAVSGGMLTSHGGLPLNLPGSPDDPAMPRALVQGGQQPPVDSIMRGGRNVHLPARGTSPRGRAARDILDDYGLNTFAEFSIIDAGPRYVAGSADIRYNVDLPNPAPAVPAKGAFIFFAPTGGTVVRRSGQILATTDSSGSYLLADFLTGGDVAQDGSIMGQMPGFGVTALTSPQMPGVDIVFARSRGMGRASHGKARAGFATAGAITPSLGLAYKMHFKIPSFKMEDHEPPYVTVALRAQDTQGVVRIVQDMAYTSDKITLMVCARDNRAPEDEIYLSVQVDGVPQPGFMNSCTGTPATVRGMTQGLHVFKPYLGALPEGRHVITVTASDGQCNKVQASLELTTISFGDPPANTMDPPFGVLAVQGGSAETLLDSTVRVLFSEPVTGISESSLTLSHLVDGVPVTDTVKRYGPQGLITGGQAVGEVILLTSGQLHPGTVYTVTWTDAVQDAQKRVPSGKPLTFTTVSKLSSVHQDLPSWATVQAVAAVGDMFYVGVYEKATDANPDGKTGATIRSWAFRNNQWVGQPAFGAQTTGLFYEQDIVAMRAFQNVPMGGRMIGNLLLVTTTPWSLSSSKQNVLWGFSVGANPSLLFALSLGPGPYAYSPSVDYLNGIIAVGCMSTPMLLIDLSLAIKNFDSTRIADVLGQKGETWSSIIQPVYLSDPAGQNVPGNWCVGLVPAASSEQTSVTQIDTVVGYLTFGSCRGMPNCVLASSGERWSVEPSYKGEPNGVDPRMVPCPLNGGLAAMRLAIVPGIQITDTDGTVRSTNLAVGVSVAGGTQLCIVDERPATNPPKPGDSARQIGSWTPPSGGKLLARIPAVDALRKTVAVPVRQTGGAITWYVLDLSIPSKPAIVSVASGLGGMGVISGGRLFTAGTNGINCVTFYQAQSTQDPLSTAFAPIVNLEFWNDAKAHELDPKPPLITVQSTSNCYAYAINNWGPFIFPGTNKSVEGIEPGGGIHGHGHGLCISVESTKLLAISDGLSPFPIDGGYAIYLVYDPGSVAPDRGMDYHWYKLGPNGYWTHKPGATAVRETDGSGIKISDPACADQGYRITPSKYQNYSQLGGYLWVPPDFKIVIK